MLKSMTGYGRFEELCEDCNIIFEVKSVNNRYLDVNARIPRMYLSMEDKLKKLAGKYISRGKVDIFLTVDRISSSNVKLVADEALLENYISLLSEIKKKYELPGEISVSMVARNQDIFNKISLDGDEDDFFNRVQKIAVKAFESYNHMREAEGEALKNDILVKLDNLENFIENVERLSPLTVQAYKERLEAKMREVLENREIDEARLLTEVAVFADKVAVDEETTRLRSHLAQFREFLKVQTPIGRKLDFLTQELNREVNTIGSKCTEKETTHLVVEAKNEIEKIREQIQNIE